MKIDSFIDNIQTDRIKLINLHKKLVSQRGEAKVSGCFLYFWVNQYYDRNS